MRNGRSEKKTINKPNIGRYRIHPNAMTMSERLMAREALMTAVVNPTASLIKGRRSTEKHKSKND
jgi:hypothetical protein